MVPWRRLAALLVAALIAFSPALAAARAGGSYRSFGGGSFLNQGSRGSRTYDAPMQRSITPQTPPAGGTLPGYGYGYGYGSAHPFWSGLAGGLFGGWLGSMLFPHWGMGYGGGFGSVFGSLFSWLFIIGLLWFAFRLFARRSMPMSMPPLAGLGGGFGSYAPAAGGRSGVPLAIVHDDYQAFETVLKEVQAAWSAGDLNALRPWVTPEILSYFAEELAENQSQGVINHVEQVELLRGDLREAWDEGRLQYATCLLRWRALDYTVRSGRHPADADAIVDGDPRHPSEAAEIWTFARSPGGKWLLSAIQQP
jgi:predicted lipid-binding transport protein (Tim44 family)